ncbi:MAG: M48 family metallopeptidase [Clostridia bacterium]|nr:M48 family metallopeptidase [Clostridia bacterium]
MIIDKASIIRENRKSLKITITPDAKIIIYSPLKLSFDKINEIIKTKETLLNKKLNQVRETNVKNQDLFSYKKVLLLGKEYFIVPTTKVEKVFFSEDMFLVPKKYFELNKISFFIRKTLKKLAEKIITQRLYELIEQKNIKYKFTKISYGNFKSKWGSCDNNGVIKFNWRLVMLESSIIDFVILHEISHLKELNHSKQFYNILTNLYPNWKIERKKLKNLSFLLSLYNN